MPRSNEHMTALYVTFNRAADYAKNAMANVLNPHIFFCCIPLENI